MDIDSPENRVDERSGAVKEISNQWLGEISSSVRLITNEETSVPSLEPVTPDTDIELGDIPLGASSPLSVLKNLTRKAISFDSATDMEEERKPNGDSSPRTPKDVVFDSCGPSVSCDVVPLALPAKNCDETKAFAGRSLNFVSSFENVLRMIKNEEAIGAISDEEMLKCVYENLMEAIVGEHAEVPYTKTSKLRLAYDGSMTPSPAPRVTVVADTCPGAPVKPAAKARVIDLGLCRKLEF